MKPRELLSPNDMLHINTTWLQHTLLRMDQTIAGMDNLNNIQSSKVPALSTHISNLRNTDSYWQNTVKSKIMSLMRLTISYCTAVQEATDGIKIVLTQFKSDPVNRDVEIRKMLVPLNRHLKYKLIPEALATAKIISNFHDTAIGIVRDLKLDYDTISQAIQSDQDSIDFAQTQLDDVNKKLAKARETKRMLEDPCLNIVTLGIAEVANLIGDYGGQVNQYQSQVTKYMNEQTQDRQEAATLTLLLGTLVSYLQGADLISSSGNAVYTFLQQVSTQLQEALNSEESFDPDDSWANEDMDYIKQQWSDIYNRISEPENYSIEEPSVA